MTRSAPGRGGLRPGGSIGSPACAVFAAHLRLSFRTPDWDGFVSLAVTEIHHFGSNSLQVARRLRAMVEHLLRVLPEARQAALKQELSLLQRAAERFFADDEDRSSAAIGDLQGIGGGSRSS
jgi:uncharacterized membrane protein